jgi:tripartite-type tricarboxylate transporter receptor subunit TctC
MKAHWFWLRVLGLGLLAQSAAATLAAAQTYPDRPVRIISDSAPGSAVDFVLRLVADRLGQMWGQQAVAVNQPGAGGAISARAAADATPDGYTLYMPALSTFLAVPGRAPNLPLKLPRDFTPIGSVSDQPMFIAVDPAFGVATLAELITRAKQRPGEISYAVTGVGRLTHLTGELLQRRAGIKLLLVPYTGGPSHALSDVLGGRIPMIIEGYPGLAGAIQSGKLKAIATGASKRLPDFPDLPTVAETIPGFEAVGWQVLLAPVGTPQAIVSKVSDDLRKVLQTDDVRQQMGARGVYPRMMSPAEVTAYVNALQETWTPILEEIAASSR